MKRSKTGDTAKINLELNAPSPINTNSIELDDLNFAYVSRTSDIPVLKDISLKIIGSQLISVLGPNGVGKSTLIHCMNKILIPTGGSVYIGDSDIKDISISDLSKFMGYVPYTSSDSFPLSVTDTVLMGRHPHSKWGSLDNDLTIVYDILKMIGIEDLADRPFNELSAGQHQKVMLARGLAQEPKILFLDEPTSNLDIRYQLEITRLLKFLAHDRGMIVVMISHDINIAAKYSDNMILMSNGAIYALGQPNDVITVDTMKNVYDVDTRIIDDGGRPHILLIDKNPEEHEGEFSVIAMRDGDILREYGNQ